MASDFISTTGFFSDKKGTCISQLVLVHEHTPAHSACATFEMRRQKVVNILPDAIDLTLTDGEHSGVTLRDVQRSLASLTTSDDYIST